MLNFVVTKKAGFRNLWFTHALTVVGDSFYRWLALFMLNYLSKDVMNLTTLGIICAVPFLLFGSYAGILSDRLDRKKIMLTTNITSICILLMFIVFIFCNKTVPIQLIYCVGFCLCSCMIFFTSARSPSIPLVVPFENLVEANGISTTTQDMMPLIGMAVAGSALTILQKFFPESFFLIGILFNTLAFCCATFFTMRLPKLDPRSVPIPKNSEPEERGKGNIGEAISYIFKHPVLGMFLLMQVFSAFTVIFYIPTSTAKVNTYFGNQVSLLMWAQIVLIFSLFIGGIIVSKSKIKKPSKPYLRSTFIIGTGCLLMGLNTSLWGIFLINGLVGFSIPFLESSIFSYVQASVSNHLLGRITSIQSMLTTAMFPLAIFVFMPFTNQYGPSNTLMLMGTICLIGGFIGFFHRGFRNEKMPSHARENLDKQVYISNKS